MKDKIQAIFNESIEVKKRCGVLTEKIEEVIKLIFDAYQNNKKILIFGNGGSASDAQHFAAELVGRYKLNRKGLPCIALASNSSITTSLSNDFGYEQVFEKQIEALANKGDILIGISTSGNSANIINAIEKGRNLGVKTIALTGATGGKLKDVADITIKVPSTDTPRIQEVHITILHIIAEIVEKELFLGGGEV